MIRVVIDTNVLTSAMLSRAVRIGACWEGAAPCGQALLSEWVKSYSSWRPNVPDEVDTHLGELAVAASADRMVTHNYRHLLRAEFRFSGIRIVSPAHLFEALR